MVDSRGAKRGLLCGSVALAALIGLTLTLEILPGMRPPSGDVLNVPVTATTAAPDPLASAMDAILTVYRKVIVLVHEEPSLSATDQQRVYPVGERLFSEGHRRATVLTEDLIADVDVRLKAGNATTPGALERFLERLESHPVYHDADKLAFRDVLEDVAAFLSERQAASPLAQALETRVAADLKALREIQALYEEELGDTFARFQARGMPVRREAWGKYLAFLQTLYSAAGILREEDTGTDVVPETRGAARAKAEDPRETFGVGLPPKTLVLTFDDGPHPRYTIRLLEVLKKYNVPAVFFEVGQNVGAVGENSTVRLTRAAEATRQLRAAGMVVANHTYTHAQLPKLNATELAQELDRTARVLSEVVEAPAALFRPPYGARNEQVLAHLAAQQLKSVMWNIDSRDWADPIPHSIAERVLRLVATEQRGILLFHDIHERTIEALPLILDRLTAEGYRFVGWNGTEFAAAQPSATKAAGGPQPERRVAPYRESWAAVIGIDDYRRWPKLRYAVNDAGGVKDVLIQKYKFKPENVFTLINQEATRERILSILADKLGNPEVVKRDDRVFIFFAGHGITRKLPSGRDLGYIVPVEADEASYHGQSISMTNFQDIAEAIPAKHVIFVMDSCYSGLGLTRGGGASQNFLQEISRRNARQMLTAGGADQQVADNGPNGHSVFTWTLLQGLEGKADLNSDGFITGSELGAYIGPIVASLSRQTPAFGNLPGSEGGEFVFELGHRDEFLNGLSAQLDDEELRLNGEIERVRAEIARKSARNRKLRQDLASVQSELQRLDGAQTPSPTGAKAESVWTRNDRGLMLFKERRYPEALREFSAATLLDPSHALSANNVGFTHYRMAQYEEAAWWFEKTVSLDPRRAVAYLNLGETYVKLGKTAEAKQALRKYLDLQPTGKSAEHARELLLSLE